MKKEKGVAVPSPNSGEDTEKDSPLPTIKLSSRSASSKYDFVKVLSFFFFKRKENFFLGTMKSKLIIHFIPVDGTELTEFSEVELSFIVYRRFLGNQAETILIIRFVLQNSAF